MDTAIASAVVLPEPQESPTPQAASPPSGHKRRQSSVSEQDGKRRRISTDDSNDIRRDSNADNATLEMEPERRRSSAKVDNKERTRGKRLFGAVLGALSQGSSSTAQRRRAEIEKKQQAKLKLQDQENDQRKKERLDKLMAMRRMEQRKFDEQSMRIRHTGLLDMAHFLYTKAEPRLYYKPWELTPEEEDRIDEQIADAQATVDKELEDFEAQREDSRKREPSVDAGMELDKDASHRRTSVGNQHEGNGASQTNGTTNDSESISPNNQEPKEDHADGTGAERTVNGKKASIDEKQTDGVSEPPPVEEAVKEAMDENGEEVFEAAEDTVIY